jgi:hypothetical protein
MLVSAASATEAYAAWVASPGESADRQRLSDALRVAGQTSGQAVARAQRRWRDDPAQWLTFGTILTMNQRILAEVSSPLDNSDATVGPRELRLPLDSDGQCHQSRPRPPGPVSAAPPPTRRCAGDAPGADA